MEYQTTSNNIEAYVSNATEPIGKVFYIADVEKTPSTRTLTFILSMNYFTLKEVSVTG